MIYRKISSARDKLWTQRTSLQKNWLVSVEEGTHLGAVPPNLASSACRSRFPLHAQDVTLKKTERLYRYSTAMTFRHPDSGRIKTGSCFVKTVSDLAKRAALRHFRTLSGGRVTIKGKQRRFS